MPLCREVVDQGIETVNRFLHAGLGRLRWHPDRVRLGEDTLERSAERALVLRQQELTVARELAAEVDLVVVDDLGESPATRDGDRDNAMTTRLDDSHRTSLRDEHGGAADQVHEQVVLEVIVRLGVFGRACGAVLRYASDPVGAAVAEPAIDPADQPIEAVVVGADGHDKQR